MPLSGSYETELQNLFVQVPGAKVNCKLSSVLTKMYFQMKITKLTPAGPQSSPKELYFFLFFFLTGPSVLLIIMTVNSPYSLLRFGDVARNQSTVVAVPLSKWA